MRAISIFMACWSSIVWFRTFFLLPVKTVPRDLPQNYDLRRETPFAAVRKKSGKYEETVKLRSGIGIGLGLFWVFGPETKTRDEIFGSKILNSVSGWALGFVLGFGTQPNPDYL